LIFMEVLLAHLQGSDGGPIPVERVIPGRVMRTLRGYRHPGDPLKLRGFPFWVGGVETR
jgi:hypothetical protein